MGYKVVSIEVKRRAVERVRAGERMSAVAAEEGLDRRRLHDWVAAVGREGWTALRRPGRQSRTAALQQPGDGALLDREARSRRRIVELERKVAQQELDLDFFRQALRHVKARQQAAAGRGGLRSTRSSKR